MTTTRSTRRVRQHFVYFPAMEVLASSGYFGGSNALWRTRVLASYAFDETMLTEDVDVSARALLDGMRISFCPEAADPAARVAVLAAKAEQPEIAARAKPTAASAAMRAASAAV